MEAPRLSGLRFTDAELQFVVEEAAPEARDKDRLVRLVRDDAEFRKALVSDEKVFRRVMGDPEALLRISPALYFEVLLRKASRELQGASHTVERAGTQTVAVFDTREVADLLAREQVLEYLADMLASFTRIQSYTIPVRVRRGIRRRIRFNDMDIDSLWRFCETADDEQRLGLYKRMADVCLFISGVYPEYAYHDYRYPASGALRPLVAGRVRRSREDYQREGRRFYELAGDHPTARALELSEVFRFLSGRFNTATKPLSFIAAHYLHSTKHDLFGMQRL